MTQSEASEPMTEIRAKEIIKFHESDECGCETPGSRRHMGDREYREAKGFLSGLEEGRAQEKKRSESGERMTTSGKYRQIALDCVPYALPAADTDRLVHNIEQALLSVEKKVREI